MKIILVPALLVLAVACNRSSKKADMPTSGTPEIGFTESIYQVLNQKTRERVGLVYRTSYDSGRVVYWVYDLDDVKRGYVLANNRGYKYSWHVRQRDREAEFIGTDRMTFNVRRILDHNKSVVLEEIDAKVFAEQRLPGRYDKPKPAAPPPDASDQE